MRDYPVVVAGLAAFLALATLPFWYNAVAAARVDLPRSASAKQCVVPTAEMRRSHMELLNTWRDLKVRDGIHTQAGYEISLTHTCLEQCHRNKEESCDRCHAYVGLQGPGCWDCHSATTRRIVGPPILAAAGFQPAPGQAKPPAPPMGARHEN